MSQDWWPTDDLTFLKYRASRANFGKFMEIQDELKNKGQYSEFKATGGSLTPQLFR